MQNQTKPIRYLDGPAGSGKTEVLLHHAIELAMSRRLVLFAQPTVELIDKTIIRLQDSSNTVMPFQIVANPVNSGSTVGERLHNALNSPPDPCCVIFITHQALKQLQRAGPINWSLIIDEIPSIQQLIPLRNAETHSILTNHIFCLDNGFGYSSLHAKDLSSLQSLKSNAKDDSAWALFKDPAAYIAHPDYEVAVNTRSYEHFRAGKINKLELLVKAKPSLVTKFEDVVIAGANFDDSLLFKLWSHAGVPFKNDMSLAPRLRYSSHLNGERLRISYCIKVPYSKSFKNREVKGRKPLGILQPLLLSKFGDKPALWMANKNDPDDLFPSPKWKRLPAVSHGLNDYQDYSVVIALAALKRSPTEYGWFKSLGISRDEVTRATHVESIYQAVCRCSLRDPCKTDPVYVFVPDEETALELQRKFPGSTLEFLDWLPDHGSATPGRRRKHASDSARKRYHNKKKCLEQAIGKTRSIQTDPVEHLFLDDETTNIYYSRNVHKFEPLAGCDLQRLMRGPFGGFVTEFASVHAKMCTCVRWFDDFGALAAYFEELSKRKTTSKSKNLPLSPAFYGSKGGKLERKKKNIMACSGIWLDFDHDNISPDVVAQSLPELCFIAMNSYSSKPGDIRWHAYFPTLLPFSPSAYPLIVEMLVQRLKGANAHTGVDKGKRTPACLMYAPCQAHDTEGSFFSIYSEGGRAPLDVSARLSTELAKHDSGAACTPTEPVILLGDEIDQLRVDAALDQWNRDGTLPGRGDDALFKLGLELRGSGLSCERAEGILLESAALANSPEDRVLQVPRIIEELW